MELRPLILIVIAVLVVLLGLFAWRAKGSGPHKTNYRALFVVGISWIPIGLATENNVFWILASSSYSPDGPTGTNGIVEEVLDVTNQ